MSGKRYNQVMTEIGTLSADENAIWDKAGDEPLDADTKKKVTDIHKKLQDLEDERKELVEQAEMKDAARQRRDAYHTPADDSYLPTPNGKAQRQEQRAAIETVGDMFVNHPEVKRWLETIVTGDGRIPKGARVQSPPIQVDSKTLLTGASSTSAGALVSNDRLQIIDAGTFGRPLTIRDLLTNGSTGSDTVEYVRQGTHTNNAAVVAEATATGDATGAKPESAMALTVVTEPVKTIAHWIPATRRALADAPQLRTLINNFLRYGLEEELEDQVLNGDGAGENFTGIFNTTGTSTQAWDTDLLVTTRKARTKVMTQGRARPTAYVLNPADWERLDLLQDAEDRYYFGGPMVMGTPRLWGLPVVESEAMTSGLGMVADWRLAALWDREQTQILTSDSHSDFFIRNLIAILAEMRAAFGVIRPAAFVEIDLTA